MKTKTVVLNGKPDEGNLHVQFGEGNVALVKPRRGVRFCKWMSRTLALAVIILPFVAMADVSPMLASIKIRVPRIKVHSYEKRTGGQVSKSSEHLLVIALLVVTLGFVGALFVLSERKKETMKEVAQKALENKVRADLANSVSLCRCCGLPTDSYLEQPMNNQGAQDTYSVVKVRVPCCSTCKKVINAGFDRRMAVRAGIAGMVCGVMAMCAFAVMSTCSLLNAFGLSLAFGVGGAFVTLSLGWSVLSPVDRMLASFPPVAILIMKGFKLGEGSGRKACLLTRTLLIWTLFAASSAMAGDERELMPKVWIPDPPNSIRLATPPTDVFLGDNIWLDPNISEIVPMPDFSETIAAWKYDDGKTRAERSLLFAVRCPSGVKDRLMRLSDFQKKCIDISRSRSISRRKLMVGRQSKTADMSSKTFFVLDVQTAFATNAMSYHVMLASSNQTDDIELVSKRYLLVDGRYFHIGVREFVNGGLRNVLLRSSQHGRWLKEWEHKIRSCTREHRLVEFDGDMAKMDATIQGDVVAPRDDAKDGHIRVLYEPEGVAGVLLIVSFVICLFFVGWAIRDEEGRLLEVLPERGDSSVVECRFCAKMAEPGSVITVELTPKSANAERALDGAVRIVQIACCQSCKRNMLAEGVDIGSIVQIDEIRAAVSDGAVVSHVRG